MNINVLEYFDACTSYGIKTAFFTHALGNI